MRNIKNEIEAMLRLYVNSRSGYSLKINNWDIKETQAGIRPDARFECFEPRVGEGEDLNEVSDVYLGKVEINGSKISISDGCDNKFRMEIEKELGNKGLSKYL